MKLLLEWKDDVRDRVVEHVRDRTIDAVDVGVSVKVFVADLVAVDIDVVRVSVRVKVGFETVSASVQVYDGDRLGGLGVRDGV